MDLPFTKLRAAGDAWILLDRRNESGKNPDFPAIARSLCHRVNGASASGIVVLGQAGNGTVARVWSKSGAASSLLPGAALCSARWLFDTGSLTDDAIRMQTLEGTTEILVLDSRIFGVSLGMMSAGKLLRSRGESMSAMGPALLENYIGACPVHCGESSTKVLLWDGVIPKKELGALRGGSDKSLRKAVFAAVISRGQLEVYAPGLDTPWACGHALAAAHNGDFCEQEAKCSASGEYIMAYTASDASIFAASEVSYCLRGEWWLDDNGMPKA